MKTGILPSEVEDLSDGSRFYENQLEGLAEN
jgi:hypothetical protein